MKSLTQFITEKLKISNVIDRVEHTLFPKDKYELMEMIDNEIKKNGNECNLNHIDVSEITDMGNVFDDVKFDGDISDWDVSNVKNMSFMFIRSSYTGKNGGISEWNVSSVTNMRNMFEDCQFNGDISDWDVSNVKTMESMFYKSKFTGENGSLSNWDVSNVENMSFMFYVTKFDDNLSNWEINKDAITTEMFGKSPLENKKEFCPKALQ